jgi:hypothetical protein
VKVEREVPWLDGQLAEVPINDPSSKGWTFSLSRLSEVVTAEKEDQTTFKPKKSIVSIKLQFFTPPSSAQVPTIEDAIEELQDKYAVSRGSGNPVEQPYLGSLMVLRAWLSTELFEELMDIR